MSVEANKTLVRRFFEEVLNKTNMTAAGEILAPDFLMYYPTTPEPLHGLEGLKQVHLTFLAVFPDWQFSVMEEIAEEDKVVARWIGSGTHKGDLMGITPTGKKATLTGISIFRVAGGKIVEDRVEANVLRMMEELRGG